ncbi:hypothetical protein DSECCO2_308050 [anaerobic digester metagenome]
MKQYSGMTINKIGYTLAAVLLLLACAAASPGCVGTDAGRHGPAAPTSPEATVSPRETPAQSPSDGRIGEGEARSLAAAALEREIPGSGSNGWPPSRTTCRPMATSEGSG